MTLQYRMLNYKLNIASDVFIVLYYLKYGRLWRAGGAEQYRQGQQGINCYLSSLLYLRCYYFLILYDKNKHHLQDGSDKFYFLHQ